MKKPVKQLKFYYRKSFISSYDFYEDIKPEQIKQLIYNVAKGSGFDVFDIDLEIIDLNDSTETKPEFNFGEWLNDD